MALQTISVVLFTVFFSEALTLRCYNCPTPVPLGICTQTENCTSQSAQCSSITTYNASIVSGTHSCKDYSSCFNWSVNVGWIRFTSHCCASDLCNKTADSPNGRMCSTCNGTDCSNETALACKGVEDQCITGKAKLNGISITLKGCASKNFCDIYREYQEFKFIVSCRDAGLFDSAQSLTQGAVLILVPILPVLFSI